MPDVLIWSIRETWKELRRLAPLWAAQGLRHQRQQAIWERADTGGTRYELTRDTASRFLENDARTLQQRYQASSAPAWDSGGASGDAALPPGRAEAAREIRKTYEFFGLPNEASVSLEEQNECELVAEEVREPAAPRPPQPHTPSLHEDVRRFVATGVIPAGSMAFLPAFMSIQGSSVGHLVHDLRFPAAGVYVTADFSATVIPPDQGSSREMDRYQRPVQWIATAPAPLRRRNQGAERTVTAVILSPHEANELLPIFRGGHPPPVRPAHQPQHPLG